jgi:hypothetical protein
MNAHIDGEGRLIADWSDIREVVRATGLRSKKSRKIKKRWKKLVHEALKHAMVNA